MRMHKLAAVMAATTAFCSPDVAAVRLSADGMGQVLLFPFYTVEQGNSTLFSLVNTTERAKALSVRLNEARNGRTVLQFNLYLAADATWTGAVVAVGATGAARLLSATPACTVPRLVTAERDPTGTPLQDFGYTGASRDYPPALAASLGAIERTRSGFIEVIEMGELQTGDGVTQLADELADIRSNPTLCDEFEQLWLAQGAWTVDRSSGIDLPGGGLYGTGAIVNVEEGAIYGFAATALGDFYSDSGAAGGLHHVPNSDRPHLGSASNGADQVRTTLELSDGGVVTEVFPSGRALDAVSLALMQSRLFNDYALGEGVGASTEFTITFPTRHLHLSPPASIAQNGRAPFGDAFEDDGRSSTPVLNRRVDRRGASQFVSGHPCDLGPCFLPPPDALDDTSLDNSVNVIALGQDVAQPASNILGARTGELRVVTDLDEAAFSGAPDGRLETYFYREGSATVGSQVYRMVAPSGRVYHGLPALGLSFRRFINAAAAPGRVGTYGDAMPHRGIRDAGSAAIATE